ncbi:MAG: matrixin family metalloprotease [Actinomycetota bacterium]|nr:matrixin family metalloprotease [Actinomycetota bacterium]
MDAPITCPNCGAANRADAHWCARCLTRLERRGSAPLDEQSWDDAAAGYDDGFYDEAPVRRSGPLRVVALLLLIALAVAFGASSLISIITRDELTVRRGVTDPRGYRFIAVTDDGSPVRYDPCRPLHYVFNPEHAPAGAAEDVAAAARLIADATGMDIVYDGTTNEPIARTRASYQPRRYSERWAPILIGWMPHDSAIFDIDSVGVAGSEARQNARGRPVFVSGAIVLNGAEQLANGFGAGRTWGKVLLHEWGHVLGLDHVTDPAQVMNPDLVSSPATWGTGDLAGLRALGRGAGCLDVPEPR